MSLTATEYETIVRRAAALGMRPVHFGRAILLSKERIAVPKSVPTDNGWRLLLVQLSRLGNNLNQLLKVLHTTGDPVPPDLEPLLKDIRSLIARVRG
ncbi:MobC family plasmid mobilization relaxosome protein [Bradyrhizobium sp. CCGUVB1N3]|nr:plasmid mobilization relaxosome protein MobC [Bradyrhizobium sp. CCGUVB1N3]MCP3468701.1 MobC family plasmid mobilization relaxosome protein [Bradyrhizobium sp. CCGUVB1N3]